MKIYTKTGDTGQTALIGGRRVPKNHPRIEAYGTVDELMAHTALLMDMLTDEDDREFLLWILDRLMTVSSLLAAENDITKKMPVITAADIERIEKQIDEMARNLEPMRAFVLPGGHIAVSQCHVARTVCRRTERCIITLSESDLIPEMPIMLINRLSDLFFVLSRKIAKDFHVIEKKWMPIAGY